jgi:hypothetical protein
VRGVYQGNAHFAQLYCNARFRRDFICGDSTGICHNDHNLAISTTTRQASGRPYIMFRHQLQCWPIDVDGSSSIVHICLSSYQIRCSEVRSNLGSSKDPVKLIDFTLAMSRRRGASIDDNPRLCPSGAAAYTYRYIGGAPRVFDIFPRKRMCLVAVLQSAHDPLFSWHLMINFYVFEPKASTQVVLWPQDGTGSTPRHLRYCTHVLCAFREWEMRSICFWIVSP